VHPQVAERHGDLRRTGQPRQRCGAGGEGCSVVRTRRICFMPHDEYQASLLLRRVRG
jgi:hypothetical protein